MGTLRAHRTGGYSGDGVVKIARKTYHCEVCGERIWKDMPYERVYGCPVHEGAGVLLKGLDCNPFSFSNKTTAAVASPQCPQCSEELIGRFNSEGYPLWACPSCEWQSAPQRPRDSNGMKP
jgi:ribosomal protein L37AE/L43A